MDCESKGEEERDGWPERRNHHLQKHQGEDDHGNDEHRRVHDFVCTDCLASDHPPRILEVHGCLSGRGRSGCDVRVLPPILSQYKIKSSRGLFIIKRADFGVIYSLYGNNKIFQRTHQTHLVA